MIQADEDYIYVADYIHRELWGCIMKLDGATDEKYRDGTDFSDNTELLIMCCGHW